MAHGAFHAAGGLAGVLMLPDAQHPPPRSTQPAIGVCIAQSIGLDLCPPIRGVGLWPGPMLGTPVPEAAIDEDRNTSAGEEDVCAPSKARQGLAIDPKPESATMQQRTDGQLRPGVTRAVRSHASRGLG